LTFTIFILRPACFIQGNSASHVGGSCREILNRCGFKKEENMKFGSWLAAAILAPFAVMSAELCLTRYFNITTAWDYIGLALSMIAGLCCL
jgi:hypothetical protein